MHGIAIEFISENSYLLPDGSPLDIAFCEDVHQTTSQLQVKASPGSIILPHYQQRQINASFNMAHYQPGVIHCYGTRNLRNSNNRTLSEVLNFKNGIDGQRKYPTVLIVDAC